MLIPDTARLAGWAFVIWPWGPVMAALVIAAVTGITAWIRARAATAVLADLVETTVDLDGPELARQLGITCPGVLTPDVGDAVTRAGWCPPPRRKRQPWPDPLQISLA